MRARWVVLWLLLAAALTGCVRMPTDGPIVEMPADRDEPVAGTFYDPRPPRPGATREEVVDGFLEAMKATPIRTSVAAQYLSTQAQRAWTPENGVLTYSRLGRIRSARDVRVRMAGAQRYDARGAWVRALRGDRSELRFPLVLEGEEWRIDDAPDALVMPDSWFDDRYQRASLYFLDPAGRVLVPEPVHVPRGDQTATALVRGLLAGPGRQLRGVARSYLPEGFGLALSSVPIDEAGVAEVSLKGGSGVDPEGLLTEELIAQLAWTLRQEPRVRAIRVTVDDQVLAGPDGEQEIALDHGASFDPTGAQASGDLFALREGLLVRGELAEVVPTTGPFGSTQYGLRSVAVDLEGSVVTGVSGDGTALLRTDVEDPDAPVVEVVSGATELLTPAWDHAGRLWLADRGPGGTRFSLLDGDQLRSITVPGVTGRDVVRMLVSRDGSRLVTVVRGGRGDRLLVSRVRRDASGRVRSVAPPRTLELDDELTGAVVDVGWRSATSLAVLRPLDQDLLQVRVVSVDGAPGVADEAGTVRLREKDALVVGSPVPGEQVYVVGAERVYDLDDPVRDIPRPQDVQWLGYVG